MKQYISLVSKRSIVTIGAALLLGSAQHPAWAAEALDIRLPPLTQLDPPPTVSTPPPAQAPAGGIIATLDAIIATLNAYAESARATQPNWSSPLATTTGLLERRLRFDLFQQHSGNGTNTSVLDGTKALEFIVSPTTEIQVGPPPYYIRSGVAGTGRNNRGAIEPVQNVGGTWQPLSRDPDRPPQLAMMSAGWWKVRD